MQSELKRFIIKWNNEYPIDYWYRNKHGIRFNSPEHRACSFIDMYFEFLEEREMNKFHAKNKEKFAYKPDSGLFLKIKKEEPVEEIEMDNAEEERLKNLFDNGDFDAVDKMFGNG